MSGFDECEEFVTVDNVGYTADDLERVADAIDDGVAKLAMEAENAPQALEANGHQLPQSEQEGFAGRHADAAEAAAGFADRVRERVDQLRADADAAVAAAGADGDAAAAAYYEALAVPESEMGAAELVATAAAHGGFTVDSRPLDEAAASRPGPFGEPARSVWEAGESCGQQKAAMAESTGAFTHVDYDRGVPVFALSTGADATGELYSGPYVPAGAEASAVGGVPVAEVCAEP